MSEREPASFRKVVNRVLPIAGLTAAAFFLGGCTTQKASETGEYSADLAGKGCGIAQADLTGEASHIRLYVSPNESAFAMMEQAMASNVLFPNIVENDISGDNYRIAPETLPESWWKTSDRDLTEKIINGGFVISGMRFGRPILLEAAGSAPVMIDGKPSTNDAFEETDLVLAVDGNGPWLSTLKPSSLCGTPDNSQDHIMDIIFSSEVQPEPATIVPHRYSQEMAAALASRIGFTNAVNKVRDLTVLQRVSEFDLHVPTYDENGLMQSSLPLPMGVRLTGPYAIRKSLVKDENGNELVLGLVKIHRGSILSGSHAGDSSLTGEASSVNMPETEVWINIQDLWTQSEEVDTNIPDYQRLVARATQGEVPTATKNLLEKELEALQPTETPTPTSTPKPTETVTVTSTVTPTMTGIPNHAGIDQTTPNGPFAGGLNQTPTEPSSNSEDPLWNWIFRIGMGGLAGVGVFVGWNIFKSARANVLRENAKEQAAMKSAGAATPPPEGPSQPRQRAVVSPPPSVVEDLDKRIESLGALMDQKIRQKELMEESSADIVHKEAYDKLVQEIIQLKRKIEDIT